MKVFLQKLQMILPHQLHFPFTDSPSLPADSSTNKPQNLSEQQTTMKLDCEDMIIPTNNKPWKTKRLKTTENEKKIKFKSGKLQRKLIQNRLKKEIQSAKRLTQREWRPCLAKAKLRMPGGALKPWSPHQLHLSPAQRSSPCRDGGGSEQLFLQVSSV